MKCAIFDMDGTILDSMPMWHSIGMEYVRLQGFQPPADLWDHVKHLSPEEWAAYYQNHYDSSKSKKEIMEASEKLVCHHYQEDLSLKEGARELLELLNQKGIPTYLATATEKSAVTACLGRLDCLTYFSKILTCTEYNTSKSEPKIFLAAAEDAGVAPQDSVVFEDAIHALTSAKKGGFMTCAVYDKSSEEVTQPPLTDWERILKICDFSCKNLSLVCQIIKSV